MTVLIRWSQNILLLYSDRYMSFALKIVDYTKNYEKVKTKSTKQVEMLRHLALRQAIDFSQMRWFSVLFTEN